MSEKSISVIERKRLLSFASTYSMEGMWRCLHDVGSASSIQTACRSLMKLGLIAETDGKKHISDLPQPC